MVSLYYIFVVTVLVVVGPFLLLQAKARAGLSQKLGSVPPKFAGSADRTQPAVWFHAVSVGEFNAIYPLLNEFKARNPNYTVFVSTTTATGQKLAQDKVGSWAHVFYFPFDLNFAIKPWLKEINPVLVVIAETEIWPGFTYECKRAGIKLCIVNARISPRSFKRYLSMKAFFQPVIARFDGIAAQSPQEVSRYEQLGARKEIVKACGNIKFDGIKPVADQVRSELQLKLGLTDQDTVIVCGSTHEGEESIILSALKQQTHKMRLIIAPRHPERFARVAHLIEAAGFQVKRYSDNDRFDADQCVYMLDTIGQLMAYYSLASIAFVGGTLVPVGGHNLVEPYAYALPVVSGRHVHKTKDVANSLLEREALLMVDDEFQLAAAFKELAASFELRTQLGSRGQGFLMENQGAVLRTVAVIEAVLEESRPEQTGIKANIIATSNGHTG